MTWEATASSSQRGPRRGLLAALQRALASNLDRWLVWLPVALGAGIGLYFAWPVEPAAWTPLPVLLLALVALLAGRRSRAALGLAVALAAIALGFAAAQQRTRQVAAPMLVEETGPVIVSGLVAEVEPDPESRGPRIVLREPQVGDLPAEATPARVRLRMTSRDPALLLPGDRIAVRAVLAPPPEPSAPGAFDFARQAFFQQLGGVGYAVGHVAVTAEAGEGARGWGLWLQGLRQTVVERVRAVLPGDSGAVAVALLVGERAAIPEEILVAMRDSGLAHLLAISGLHLGLVTGLIFFALRAGLALIPAIALRWPIKKWAALGAVLGGFGYLLLAGAPVPTQRAFVMVSLALLGVMLDRSAISLRLVAWAAAVVLLLAPESLLSASFQLSFAAVTALVATYEALRERRAAGQEAGLSLWGQLAWGERGPLARFGLYLGGLTLTSLVAGLATAPFAIYHFQRFPLYGLAGNMIAVPLTAFWVMPCALAALLLMPLGLEALALIPMGWGLDLLLGWAALVASWPEAALPLPAMPFWGLLAATFGGLWLCLWRGSVRLWGLPVLVGVLVAIWSATTPDLLVTGDGRLFALKGEEGRLWLSTGRRERFAADLWLRRSGQTEKLVLGEEGAVQGGRLRCDPLGCLLEAPGGPLAVVRDGRALGEDCARARVVVSLAFVPRGSCEQPQVLIGRWDLKREGAHSVSLAPGAPRIETVAGKRGARPWVRAAPPDQE